MVDKLSRGLHTVSCVIGCVSLDFILALLVGHDECVCADGLAGYWQRVHVCLYRLCVRIDLWVCVPLPLVPLMSKTLTSSEKRHIISPQPIITQNYYFKSLLKMGRFCADYCSSRLEHNCIQCLKVLVTPKPSASSSHALCLKILLCLPVVIFEYLFSRLPIRAHQSEQERAAWSRAACSDPALVLEPTHIQTEAFKHSPAVAAQQEAQWTCVTSSVSVISTRMHFHYFVKGKRTGINNSTTKRAFSLFVFCIEYCYQYEA